MNLMRLTLIAAHVLAGAAWFGAMFYSLVVLYPRSRKFFKSPREFEEFVAYLANGARWKVLGGAAFVALTGVGLLFLTSSQPSDVWYTCIYTKGILFIAAIGLFCFTSWVLWPARSMASSEEIPKFQRKFRLVGITLLILVGASAILGVIASHLLKPPGTSTQMGKYTFLPSILSLQDVSNIERGGSLYALYKLRFEEREYLVLGIHLGDGVAYKQIGVYAPDDDQQFHLSLMTDSWNAGWLEVNIDQKTGLLEIKERANSKIKGQVVLSCNLRTIGTQSSAHAN